MSSAFYDQFRNMNMSEDEDDGDFTEDEDDSDDDDEMEPIEKEVLITPNAPVAYMEECPIQFPSSSFPGNLNKLLKGIVDPALRAFWKHTLSGNFKAVLAMTPSKLTIKFISTNTWEGEDNFRVFSYVADVGTVRVE